MNITELKALAEKATPGPWVAMKKDDANPSEGSFFLMAQNSGAIGYQRGHKGYHADHQLVFHENDATYLAAANPAAIQELIAQLEEASAQMERQKDEWLSWEAKRRDLEKAAAELEALKKAIGDAEPVAHLIERHSFYASQHGQDAEGRDRLEVTDQKEVGSFAVYTLKGIK